MSGGGGGRKVTQEIAEEQCYPKDIYGYLKEEGYIVDERLDSLLVDKKLYKPHRFFDRLVEKNQKRTETFIELANRFDIDFGFVVYKSSSNLAEFGAIPNIENNNVRLSGKNVNFLTAVDNYYRNFDQQIKSLVESFPECEVILCSDHGMEFRKRLVNPNKKLQDLGFQKVGKSSSGILGFAKNIKQYVPFSLRHKLKKIIGVEKIQC